MIKVWHRDNNSKYRHVATVDTDIMGWAFERTNTIDRLWQENEDVTVTEKGQRARSTGVGDVLELSDNSFYLVRGVGFARIEKANFTFVA